MESNASLRKHADDMYAAAQQMERRIVLIQHVLNVAGEFRMPLVTQAQAAAILGVTPERVGQLAKAGRVRKVPILPANVTNTRRERTRSDMIPLEDLLALDGKLRVGGRGRYGVTKAKKRRTKPISRNR